MNSLQLQVRLNQFACRILPLCESLPVKKISRVIEDQLVCSAFSAAANYRAACKAQSNRAFTAKLSIAFEEMDESLFWLEMIAEIGLVRVDKMTAILKEADELTRILAASRKTSQQRNKETGKK